VGNRSKAIGIYNLSRCALDRGRPTSVLAQRRALIRRSAYGVARSGRG
jgi:hypothetical protein